ncbi:MAG: hypothetical protein ACI83W_000407 [Marinoscillum sp.]|jgi:hypothetical protein
MLEASGCSICKTYPPFTRHFHTVMILKKIQAFSALFGYISGLIKGTSASMTGCS